MLPRTKILTIFNEAKLTLLKKAVNHPISGERYGVTCSHRSRRFDHGVHARARELTGIADLKPVVPSERSKDVGVLA